MQHHAGLTNARLGLALFAASLGALVAMPLAGRLCERIGSRRVTLAALLLGSGSLFAASLATGLVGPRRGPLRLRCRLRCDQRLRQRPGRRARAALRAVRSSRRSTPRSRPAASSEPGTAALVAAAGIRVAAALRRARRSSSPRSGSPACDTCSRPRPTTGPRRKRGAARSPGRRGRSSCSARRRSARCSPRAPPSTGAPSTCRARSERRPASRRSPTPHSRS